MNKTPIPGKKRWMEPIWLKDTAESLRVLAHPVRLRIIELITRRRCNVKEIAEHCNLPHSQTSEHLRLMKIHGLLDAEKESRDVYYCVVSPLAWCLLKYMKRHVDR